MYNILIFLWYSFMTYTLNIHDNKHYTTIIFFHGEVEAFTHSK